MVYIEREREKKKISSIDQSKQMKTENQQNELCVKHIGLHYTIVFTLFHNISIGMC